MGKTKTTKTKKAARPQIIIPRRVSGVEYDYDRTYCTGQCEDYCRCTRIVGERVTEISDWNSLVSSFCPEDIGDFDYYLIDRFLRKLLSLADFEIQTSGGWYGEEVDGVIYNSSNSAFHRSQIDAFNKLESQTERLHFVLRQEYGSLLPEIEEVRHWEIRKVKINLVTFGGHMQHMDSQAVAAYTRSVPKVTCLCLPTEKGFRLMDGRHRFTAQNQVGATKISILVPKGSCAQKNLSREDEIRKHALAKLTDEEKIILGLI